MNQNSRFPNTRESAADEEAMCIPEQSAGSLRCQLPAWVLQSDYKEFEKQADNMTWHFFYSI